MSDLTGKTVAITGASSGLGQHFAHLLADRGANLALMARRTDRLEAEVEALRAKGSKAIAIALDVSNVAAIGPALDAAETELGPIHVLINTAGIGGGGMALPNPPEPFPPTFPGHTPGRSFGARGAAPPTLAPRAAAARSSWCSRSWGGAGGDVYRLHSRTSSTALQWFDTPRPAAERHRGVPRKLSAAAADQPKCCAGTLHAAA